MRVALVKFQHEPAFFGLVKTGTLHCLIEIYFPAVELRTVNACELYLAADQEPACSAHSGSVDHDRVHRNDGGDAELFGELACELHHDDRSDDDAVIVTDAFIPKLLECNADIAVDAVGTVIGSKVEILRNGLHLVFENEKVLVPCTLDAVDFNAVVMKSLELVINGSRAYAACDEEDLFLFEFFNGKIDEIGRPSQRTYDIGETVADPKIGHALGLCADDRENDGDDAFFTVIITNGERDSLAFIINADDEKLSGHCLTRNKRCNDFHEPDVCSEMLFVYDLKHDPSPPWEKHIFILRYIIYIYMRFH